MQTFLPYHCFTKTAKVLDYRRLMKQRVEAMQILDTLGARAEGWTGWINHPAVCMWRGYEEALKYYLLEIHKECKARGINVNDKALYPYAPKLTADNLELPWWFGLRIFHNAHKLNLIWKEPPFYTGKFGLEELDASFASQPPYTWPYFRHEWSNTPLGLFFNRTGKHPKVISRQEVQAVNVHTHKMTYYTHVEIVQKNGRQAILILE